MLRTFDLLADRDWDCRVVMLLRQRAGDRNANNAGIVHREPFTIVLAYLNGFKWIRSTVIAERVRCGKVVKCAKDRPKTLFRRFRP